MLRVRVYRRDETAESGGDGRVFDVRGGGVGRFRGVFCLEEVYVCFYFF